MHLVNHYILTQFKVSNVRGVAKGKYTVNNITIRLIMYYMIHNSMVKLLNSIMSYALTCLLI